MVAGIVVLRWLAPVDAITTDEEPFVPPGTDLNLQKVLWTNIADLRLAEERRVRRRLLLIRVGGVTGVVMAMLLAWYLVRIFS